jgi:hypothetical protein
VIVRSSFGRTEVFTIRNVRHGKNAALPDLQEKADVDVLRQ